MSALQQKIEAAKGRGRPAVIASIVAGFPASEEFFALPASLTAGGADIIEISVPFSDPAAEGPLAEEAFRAALKDGFSIGRLLKGLERRPARQGAALVIAGYMNPFYQYGFENLAAECAAAGVCGVMAKDLPLEEAEPFQKILAGQGIDLICMLGANTPDARLEAYARLASGYALVLPGSPEGAAELLERCRRHIKIPLAVPAAPGDAARAASMPAAARPDALVFGEALLAYLKSGGKAEEFMRAFYSGSR